MRDGALALDLLKTKRRSFAGMPILVTSRDLASIVLSLEGRRRRT